MRRDEADPLDLVNSGGADYAIVDANEFAFAQHLYPEAVVAFSLPNPRQVQWMVPENAAELQQAANRFIESAQNSGQLAQIEAAAHNESGDFDYESAHQFQADIAARLPALQSLFEEASQTTGLDWRLLAAVGYQESKWQGAAASSDGARGIMMLTNDAASTVGVDDRADLRQNIVGGARYLAQVIDTIPKRIAEPDRTWLALAAYNVGYGHLEDARVLAQMRGKNPDSWSDVRGAVAAAGRGAVVHAGQARLRARLGAGKIRRAGAPVPVGARMDRRGQDRPHPRHDQPLGRNRRHRSAEPPAQLTRPLGSTLGGGPVALEESAQQLAALLRENAAERIDSVIESRQTEHVDETAGGTELWIPRAEHQPRHARVHQGRGAHDARLQGYVKHTAAQAIVAQRGGARAQCLDLRVRGGIAARDRSVATRGDDPVFMHQHCADRNLAGAFGLAGLLQRPLHVVDVGSLHHAFIMRVQCYL